MNHVLNKCTKDEFLEYNQAIQNLLCGNQFFHITHHPYTSFMYHCVRSEFYMVSSRSDYKPWPYARTSPLAFSISNLSPKDFYAYSLNRVLELQNLAIRDLEHEMKKIRKNLKDAKKQTINTMNEIKRIKSNEPLNVNEEIKLLS